MAEKPIWITEEAVRIIHQRQIAEHGGDLGIRDEDLLLSALARPQNLLAYSEKPKPDAADLAAAYAFGIARNHPFIDGNKRTAYVVMRVFLVLNKSDIKAEAEEKYQTFIKIAEGNLTQEELAVWIREHLKK